MTSVSQTPLNPGARVNYTGHGAATVTGPSYNRLFTSVIFDEPDAQGGRTADVPTAHLEFVDAGTIATLDAAADALGKTPTELLEEANATPCPSWCISKHDRYADPEYHHAAPEPVASLAELTRFLDEGRTGFAVSLDLADEECRTPAELESLAYQLHAVAHRLQSEAQGIRASDLAASTPSPYAFPLAPCRTHTFQWEDGEHSECYRCGAPKAGDSK